MTVTPALHHCVHSLIGCPVITTKGMTPNVAPKASRNGFTLPFGTRMGVARLPALLKPPLYFEVMLPLIPTIHTKCPQLLISLLKSRPVLGSDHCLCSRSWACSCLDVQACVHCPRHWSQAYVAGVYSSAVHYVSHLTCPPGSGRLLRSQRLCLQVKPLNLAGK